MLFQRAGIWRQRVEVDERPPACERRRHESEPRAVGGATGVGQGGAVYRAPQWHWVVTGGARHRNREFPDDAQGCWGGRVESKVAYVSGQGRGPGMVTW